jgi:hypothetical protein
MLYGPDGRPITVHKPNKPAMRRGNQVNVFELPPGAVISQKLSQKLHNMIRNNSKLREDIEAADRATGTRTLHLEVMRPGHDMSPNVEKALMNNQISGEMIMRERTQTEGNSLNKSGEGYEKAAA